MLRSARRRLSSEAIALPTRNVSHHVVHLAGRTTENQTHNHVARNLDVLEGAEHVDFTVWVFVRVCMGTNRSEREKRENA